MFRNWQVFSGVLVLLSGLTIVVPALAADDRCTAVSEPALANSTNVRQPPLVAGPTVVDVSLSVVEITDIDVLNGRFQFQAYTDFSWCDTRLATEFDNGPLERVYVGSEALKQQEKIWSADLSMVNEVEGMRVRKRELSIRDDGRVRVRGYFSAHLAAPFDLNRFPFDSQILPIQVGSLTWNENIVSLRMIPGGIGVDQDFELAEWEVGKVSGAIKSVTRGSSDVRFAQLEVTTTIHRRVGYYLWRAALPLFLIVGLGWTVFWMPDGLSSRIRLSATVMLTIVAYQFALVSDLPKVADINLFSAFMTLSCVVICSTVGHNVFVFNRGGLGSETIVNRSDHLCRWLVPVVYVVSVAVVGWAYLG
jgi:hypothetical protein